MARRWRHCLVEGCERRAMTGRMVCKDHEGTAIDVETSRGIVKLEREVRALMMAESNEERLTAAIRFRQRVQRGDFAALFAGKFRELIQQAGLEEGLTNEIGALRLAVVRLIMEEEDPTKMATALSKVTNATVNAMKAQEVLSDQREELKYEIKQAWKTFGFEKQKQEEMLEARWTDVWEAERQNGGETARPSPQPSPQAGRGSFGEDEDGEVFDVVEGGFLGVPGSGGIDLELERQGREAWSHYDLRTAGSGEEEWVQEQGVGREEPGNGEMTASDLDERARWMEGYLRALREWEETGK